MLLIILPQTLGSEDHCLLALEPYQEVVMVCKVLKNTWVKIKQDFLSPFFYRFTKDYHTSQWGEQKYQLDKNKEVLTLDETISQCLFHLAKDDLPGMWNLLETQKNGCPETVLEQIKIVIAIAIRGKLVN